MKTLEPPDTHYFTAAVGWLELGMPREAASELEHISPACQTHPDVMEIRWLVCAEQSDWARAVDVARHMVCAAPNRSSAWLHQAYALRRVEGGGVLAAWEALLPAAGLFPKVAVIPYNLACYACQMHQPDEALRWLQRAFHVGDKQAIKALALRDEDLEPLREQIETM